MEKLPDELLRKTALSLFSVPPLLHRKTRRKMGQTGDQDIDRNLTHLHVEILRVLDEEHTLRVAEIGKMLHVAKAQMTQLISKLVELNLVARQTDLKDRRAINITLTEQGKNFLEKCKYELIANLQELLADLSQQELKELFDSLDKIQHILNKL
jgi:DNA-binding MarR family transcriptional regulator